MSLRRSVRFSDHWAARYLRALYYFPSTVHAPAPRVAIIPVRVAYEAVRDTIYFLRRVLIAEPALKSYCTSYGKGLRTGVYIPWVTGRGDMILGHDVLIDGKCSFKFAARYVSAPTLVIGDHTGIGHGCSFTVGKRIEIGSYCRIAGNVTMFDSPGHAMDPESRRAGMPAADAEVKPITLGSNVWVGKNSTIFPGVSIGDNSVVASDSVVMNDVPANTVVGGNPARKMGVLREAMEAAHVG